jgi:membrane-anchored protein YejM (alkaline phosphatase superfamily)
MGGRTGKKPTRTHVWTLNVGPTATLLRDQFKLYIEAPLKSPVLRRAILVRQQTANHVNPVKQEQLACALLLAFIPKQVPSKWVNYLGCDSPRSQIKLTQQVFDQSE